VTELEYKFTNDTLFKMLFVQHPDLLKRLVALMLHIALENITEFEITNSEIPPEIIGEKFCRLDINMKINAKRVDLEIQVNDEHDYPERSLYYWSREYSTALMAGHSYLELPQVIVINIVDFSLFSCEEYFSRFQLLEVSRHTLLTDRLDMRFYELRKLPDVINTNDEEKLMLALFKAKTEEELKRLERMEVSIVQQTIGAYRQVVVSSEFRELERLRKLAHHNEVSALQNARREEREKVNAEWQTKVAENNAEWQTKVAENNAEWQTKVTENNAEWQTKLAELEAKLARYEERQSHNK
jgi:predicted transposase/invertase (TIGR01784 family)